MATITDWATLKSTIADFLARDDLTSIIPTFIQSAELKLNRKIRVRGLISRSSITISARNTTLPTDYQEHLYLTLQSSPLTKMRYITPDEMDRVWAGSDTGKPVAYTIIGSEIRVGPAPDSTYTAELSYYQKPTALSDSNTTNWYVSNIPDILLYACLLEAEPYLKNDGRIQTWATLYQSKVDDLEEAEYNSRYPQSSVEAMSFYGRQ